MEEIKEKINLFKTIWRLDLFQILSTKRIAVLQGRFMEPSATVYIPLKYQGMWKRLANGNS